MTHYVLQGRRPVLELDVVTWSKWFETAKRHVAENHVHGVRISTVFLGLDHSFGRAPGILFETMVFGGPLHGEQLRYRSWIEAVRGHRRMLTRIRGRQRPRRRLRPCGGQS